MTRLALLVAAVLAAGSAKANKQLILQPSEPVQRDFRATADVALPDPTMTPGGIDPAVTLSEICNGTTKKRRPRTTAVCDQVFAAYSIPAGDRYSYECDHLVPVALGGNSTAANLWPQPNAEAEKKDALEVEMQRRACVAYRTLTPADAAKVLADEQRELATDWPGAYRRYMGR